MSFRMVILYIFIFLFDTICCAHVNVKIKRQQDKQSAENDEVEDADQKDENKDENRSEHNQESTGEKNKEVEETSVEVGTNENGHIKAKSTDEDRDVDHDGDLNSNIEKNDVNDNNQDSNTEIGTDKKQNQYEEDEANHFNNDNEATVRPYKVGDTFTPQELLPITIKLRSKVRKPGSGKGFVSSSQSPEQLADKLFEAFFMTFKRIVTLEEPDIAGLDALQALALSGEAVQDNPDTVTEPAETKYLRGQFIRVRSEPRTSKFTLIAKRIDPKKEKKQKTKRQGIELAKKLRKKRRLVVNKHRRAQGDKIRILKKKRRLIVNKRRNGENQTTQKQPACHWGYECSDPSDLDTCQLFTKCADHKEASKGDYISVAHNSDEHSKSIKQFRKMLGISLIDEEVEKILESRIITLKPSSLNANERVESLSEYFNNIIMEQELRTTTALSPSAKDDDTTEINDNATEEENKKLLEIESKKKIKEDDQDKQIRKSLKFPIKSTQRPAGF